MAEGAAQTPQPSALRRPVPIASLAALRILYGILGVFGATRFLASGWVARFYGTPEFFFRYEGFEWVPVPSEAGVTALFWVMAASGLAVALGWRTRLALAVHVLAFAWVELIDVTNYLNHYYLYTILGALLFALPCGAAASLDARAGRTPSLTHIPAGFLWLLRLQVAIVYLGAAVAKAQPDWLLHGQPLNLWLSARSSFPILGPLFDAPWMALAMSWAGFLHDLLVPGLLLWRPTRGWAYMLLLGFHAMTLILFQIGLFPVIMAAAATVFLAPDWPLRLRDRLARLLGREVLVGCPQEARGWRPPASRAARSLLWGLAGAWVCFQVLMPLRTFLHPGPVIWHEVGMRWSWRVMLREKNGAVTYRVRSAERPRDQHIAPHAFLTPDQEREMASQPDMIWQLGRHLADLWRARGHTEVEVRVDAVCSLNGRPPARLIDPEVDLAALADADALIPHILPAPDGAPPMLRPIRLARTTP
jgi:vitamin K-dependent gamma-carboxylase